MNSKEYVKNVLKTESIDFDRIRGRLTNQLLKDARVLLDNAIDDGSDVDCLKKLLFYGKDITIGTNDPSFTPEQAEEIRSRLTDKNIRLLHAAMGKVTEAAEFLSMLYEHIFSGEELDEVNLEEEIGDGFWYDGVAISALGKDSFDRTFDRNIEKLRARYGSKFSEESAINRKLDVERQILEQED